SEYDLAGRRRDVDAELERLRIGHRDLELSITALDIVQQVVHSAHEVLPARGNRFAKHFRIGQREVRWRQRIDVLARKKIDLLFRVVRKAFDASYLIVQPARGDQVGLLDV